MKRIELKSIEDLVLLASSSPFGSVIQHFRNEKGEDIYFMFGGTRSETYIFYVRSEKIDHKFINLDTTQNKIVYSNKPIIDPKFKVTPVIEVKKQDLFKTLL
ncbi:hypothetical protein DRO58_05815 [Candidatus Bathyarchaeota archaeon]|nr:MAG: hypothetical protein DRO58_05815 [Candidatus Bathyarchaeota archaeon]